MITKFLSEIKVRYNPFSPCAKPARLILCLLPPNARALGTVVTTTILPRTSKDLSTVSVKFKDGKQLNFETDKITINGIAEEIDRHSRKLQKKVDLTE